MTLDEIRAAHPALGFAVYAMTPGEDVTLEVYGPDGSVFSFTGPTEQVVLDLAFPPIAEPEPIIDVFS
jgi:hypothetical protein